MPPACGCGIGIDRLVISERQKLEYTFAYAKKVAMSQITKLFMRGRSQVVRLPAAFRFDTKKIFIRKDPATGDVILSRRPDNWDGFFAALNGVDVPDDFLCPEERQQDAPERDPL